jgi:glucokinase
MQDCTLLRLNDMSNRQHQRPNRVPNRIEVIGMSDISEPPTGQMREVPLGALRAEAAARIEPRSSDVQVVVGLDNGGTMNNATVVDFSGAFLISSMLENPSRVSEGPEAALAALGAALDQVLAVADLPKSSVRAVGLDTPGPASAEGVISSRGSTNFAHSGWRGLDFRGALEQRIGLPVIYSNDGNAAALYAHEVHFRADAETHSSVSAIVGTGLGGGLVHCGRIIKGAVGMAGEIGHVHIPMLGLLDPEQPLPHCNCGFVGDAESVASLTGIEKNLLPYWLTRFPEHALAHAATVREAAKLVRTYADDGDPMALQIFRQQAMALGRLFTITSNLFDPDAYFIGGGVVDASPHFRDWFLASVKEHTVLRREQELASFALIPDLDMAGARGVALLALDAVLAH